MTIAATGASVATDSVPAGPRVRRLADGALWLAVFSGGFVLWEPGPHELLVSALIPLFLFAGLPVRGSSGPLIAALLAFTAGGFLSVTQVTPDLFRDGMIYMAVTLFLAVMAIWYAALVADDWTRVRIVEQAMIAAAVVAALVGILAYFRLLPGSDQFLLYGRARGTFKDPNVFGPFLVLPALFLARRLMTRSIFVQPGAVACFAILFLGVFLSFSRAAWALLAVTLTLLAMVVSANAPTNRQRLRLTGLVVLGCCALVALVMVAMSIPAVQELLVQRAKLVQDYDGKDGAELGRFARHWVGFQMALDHPLGIGPFEFPRLYIEATHNSYLKALMEYGWLGFAAYVAAIAMTVRRAIPLLYVRRPWAGFAQCVSICFLVHLAVGWIIDTDHWRHVFVMMGLIWGLHAAARAPHPVGRFAMRRNEFQAFVKAPR